MAAPRIDHQGSARVNGSVAYVAAELVDLTINSGLFDINVQAGTEQANPLFHGGTTGGPASSMGGDNHAIYMVAVPKNTAITAVLQGSIGFDSAVSATVENGAIILSSGFNVSGTHDFVHAGQRHRRQSPCRRRFVHLRRQRRGGDRPVRGGAQRDARFHRRPDYARRIEGACRFARQRRDADDRRQSQDLDRQ